MAARKQKAPTEEEHSSNGHVTLESLAESLVSLTAVVGELSKHIQPADDFAPDDDDLRSDAEATAAAIKSGEAGVSVNSLGKSDKKGKASEMLVQAMFDTPAGKLDEMTDIHSSLEAAAFAGVRTLNEFVLGAFDRKPGAPPVMMSDMYLDNLFKLNRSINGRHMLRAMAMSSLEREKEQSQENNIVFGSGGGED